MAFEKAWDTVFPTLLTANGGAFGLVQVADTIGFYVKGLAQLTNNVGLTMVVQVNQVISSTEMIVGKPGSSPSATAGGLANGAVVDVSSFTTATASTIGFAMQPKNKIKPDDIEQATYAGDPVTAVRVIPVDPYGNLIGKDNPLPVTFDGTIDIGKVEVVGSTGNILEPNTDGSLNIEVSKSLGLFDLPYDSIGATYPSSTVEQYQSYLGGLSGTPVQLIVITYTDSTKNYIASAVRTPTGP
jgi:hypothetical protein